MFLKIKIITSIKIITLTIIALLIIMIKLSLVMMRIVIMICAYPVQNHLFSIIAPEHYKLQSIIIYDNDNYHDT